MNFNSGDMNMTYFVVVKDRDGCDIYADEMPTLKAAKQRANEFLNDPEIQEDAHKVEITKDDNTKDIIWDAFKK